MSTNTDAPQRVTVTPGPIVAPDDEPPIDLPVIEVSDRDGECPRCGHEAVDEETALDRWIGQTWRKLTRRKPKPARRGFQPWDCDWETSEGPQCTCRHSYHGS